MVTQCCVKFRRAFDLLIRSQEQVVPARAREKERQRDRDDTT